MDNSDLTDSGKSRVVSSNSELTAGDLIEAYYKGSLVHRGEVTDIAPSQELFWIYDTLTGGRRLLDTTEFEIRKSHPQSLCQFN